MLIKRGFSIFDQKHRKNYNIEILLLFNTVEFSILLYFKI